MEAGCGTDGRLLNHKEIITRIMTSAEQHPGQMLKALRNENRFTSDSLRDNIQVIAFSKFEVIEPHLKEAMKFAAVGCCTGNLGRLKKNDLNCSPTPKTPEGGWTPLGKLSQQAHTLGTPSKVQEYKDNRWSIALQSNLKEFGAIVIFGARHEATQYMANREWVRCIEYKGRSSAKFTFYHPQHKPEEGKVVVLRP